MSSSCVCEVRFCFCITSRSDSNTAKANAECLKFAYHDTTPASRIGPKQFAMIQQELQRYLLLFSLKFDLK